MNLVTLLRSRFLRDSSVLQAGAAFTAVGGLATAVALSHLLGARGQGGFYVAVSLYSLVWFVANLGLASVTVTQVAGASARGLPTKAAAWLAFLAKAHALLASGTAALSFLVLPALAEGWLGTGAGVGRLGAVLAMLPVLELPRVVVSASLQAGRRMLALARVEVGQEALRVFLVVIGALSTGEIGGAVAGTLAAAVIGSLVALRVYSDECRRTEGFLPALGDILRHVRDVPLRRGLPLCLRMGAVQNLMAIAYHVLPVLLLQRFGSAEWVAYLRIAHRIMGVSQLLLIGISRTVVPVLGRLAGTGDLRAMCRAYFRACLWSGALISSGILLGLPLVPLLVDRLFPVDYHAPVWLLCRILAPGFMLLAFSVANDTFYLITDKLGVAIGISLVGSLVNAALLTVFAWRWPTVGVAWALDLTMAMSLVHVAYAAYWYRRHLPRRAGALR